MASLSLTPRGHLLFTVEEDAFSLSGQLVHRLEAAFGRGSGHGLFELGAGEVGTALPADLSYWRDFGARFVTAICTHPDYQGRGYGARIVSYLTTDIIRKNEVPLLHAKMDNTTAMKAYIKSGYEIRRNIQFYIFRKKRSLI